MALTEYVDYVYSPNVNMIIDKGVFVGTKDYFFCFPVRSQNHEMGKVITTTYSFAGKEMHQAIWEIIQMAKSVKELEEQLTLMARENKEVTIIKIDDLGCFKVAANFFGSGIHTNEKDRKVGWNPFIQSLGKERKQKIKEFYSSHPKIR